MPGLISPWNGTMTVLVIGEMTMKIAYKKGRTTKTTYEREMDDPEFRKGLAEEEARLALSELLITLMEEEEVSVRELARRADVSASIIQDLRSGKRDNPTFSSFARLIHSMGFEIAIKRGRKTYARL